MMVDDRGRGPRVAVDAPGLSVQAFEGFWALALSWELHRAY
jgi:hypothetical protein